MRVVRLILFALFLSAVVTGVAMGEWEQYQRGVENKGGYEGNGSLLSGTWRYNATGVTSSVVVVNGTVYFGDSDGVLRALDLSEGATRWNYSANSKIWRSPTVSEDSVHFMTKKGVLHSLSKLGEPRWKYDIGGRSFASPAVVNASIYTANRSRLYSFEKESGGIEWSTEVQGWIASSPTVADSVYIGTMLPRSVENVSVNEDPIPMTDGFAYSVNRTTGEVEWRRAISGVVGTPAVREGTVFFSSAAGDVYALDSQEGEIIWETETNYTHLSAPVFSDGSLYLSSKEGYIFSIDPRTGRMGWVFGEARRGMDLPPSIVSGRIYSGDSSGPVYSLEANSGDLIWAADMGQVTSHSLTVINRTVYVAGDNVYGIKNGDTTVDIQLGDNEGGGGENKKSDNTSGGASDLNPLVAIGVFLPLMLLLYLVYSEVG